MEKLNKTCAIIQARMRSSRMPNKIMAPINMNPVIGWVVSRVKAVNILKPGLLDEIVVATTSKPEDNIIQEWCNGFKIECFRGHETDVLNRYYECASVYQADWILRITADCPLIEPMLLCGLLIKQPRKPYQALAVNRHAIPLGWDAELFSMDELRRAEAKGPDEHVTTRMRKANENSQDYGLPFDYSGIKLDLDTPEDLERIKNYVKYL